MERFTKEALESLDGKVIPLVTYIGGARSVIGSAVLRTDEEGLMVDAMTLGSHIAEFKGELPNDHQSRQPT